MQIGIIGSGNIGGTAAKLFAKAGHEVAISNSRGPESLKSFVSSVGPNIMANTVEDAIKFGEVIYLQYHGGEDRICYLYQNSLMVKLLLMQ